jgi:hypothetical protein
MGTCGDWVFTLGLVEELEADDGSANGICAFNSLKHEATIGIHGEVAGRAALNTVIHEFLHLISVGYGLDLSHKTIYTITSGLTQMATPSGLINEHEFEARLRSLTGPPEKLPEEKK